MAKHDTDLILETDGSTKKTTPGPSAWAFVALSPWGSVVYEDCAVLPQPMTSNEAEYWGAVKALEFARDLGYPKKIELRSDSKTMINQLKGGYCFQNQDLANVAKKAADLLDCFELVQLYWVPRRWNEHANRLANAAFMQYPKREIAKIDRASLEKLPDDWKDWELS